MAAELAGDGIKLLVVASLQATEDALEPIAAAAGVRTLGSTRRWCTPRPGRARDDRGDLGRRHAARAQPWIKAHRFQRGGVEVVPLPWAGLAAAVEAGRAPDPATAPEVPADCIVALICPYAAMAAAQFDSRSTAPR